MEEAGDVRSQVDEALAKIRENDPEVDRFLAPLRALADRHAQDLPGFLSALTLGVDIDLWDPRAEAVSLLTLHASKGLEFPVNLMSFCR